MQNESKHTLSGSFFLTIVIQIICLTVSALILDTGVTLRGFLFTSIIYWAYIAIITIRYKTQKQPFNSPAFIYQVRYMWGFFIPLGIGAALLLRTF